MTTAATISHNKETRLSRVRWDVGHRIDSILQSGNFLQTSKVFVMAEYVVKKNEK